MYCRHCYASLDPSPQTDRCGHCGRPFDPSRPRTFLTRPFPSWGRVIVQLVATTLLGFAAAQAIAFFQAAGTSGH